jgi:hypothetical protein
VPISFSNGAVPSASLEMPNHARFLKHNEQAIDYIDLIPAAKAMVAKGRICVVIVMPPLTQIDHRDDRVVARIAGVARVAIVGLAAKKMT